MSKVSRMTAHPPPHTRPTAGRRTAARPAGRSEGGNLGGRRRRARPESDYRNDAELTAFACVPRSAHRRRPNLDLTGSSSGKALITLFMNSVTLRAWGRVAATIACLGTALAMAKSQDSSADVIETVRRLGGDVVRRHVLVGQPVVGVTLAASKAGDEDLSGLASLHSMEELDLKRCQRITGAGLKHLTGSPRLHTLDLSECDGVTNASLPHVARLKNLRSLDLSFTRVTDEGLKELSGCTELEELDLTGTDFDGSGLVHLSGLKKLRRLSMYRTSVGDAALAHIAPLKELRDLGIGACPVGDNGLKHLVGLKNLRALAVFDANVTDAGLQHVARLTRLRQLHLRRPTLPTRGSNIFPGLASSNTSTSPNAGKSQQWG